MSAQPNPPRGPGPVAAIATAVLACIALGSLEWLRHCTRSAGVNAANAGRVLLGIYVLYGALGLLTGVIAAFVRAERRAAIALGLPLGVLLGLGTLTRDGHMSVGTIALAAGLALGVQVARYSGRASSLANTRWSAAAPACVALLAALTLLPSLAHTREALEKSAVWGTFALCVLATIAALALGQRLRTLALSLGGLALLAPVAASAWLGFHVVVTTPAHPLLQRDPKPPSVLLITIDTLRSDHLGAYGYAKARTPVLDSFAKAGVLFQQTVTHTFMTGPSHTSILTGLLPDNHGVVANGMKAPTSIRTAPQIFGQAGYTTAAFIGGFTTTNTASGLPSRFQYYDDDLRSFRLFPEASYYITLFVPLRAFIERHVARTDFDRPAGETVELATRWLDVNADKPFFVWVHMFDPHVPYTPPPEYLSPEARNYKGPANGQWYTLDAVERANVLSTPQGIAHMVDLYDAEIAYADHEVGRLLAAVRARVPAERLIVAIASDHGESLGEHQLYFGRDLYDDTLLVPLMFQAPGLPAGNQVASQVRLIDVLPTLLELAHVNGPAHLDGTSLTPLMQGRDARSPGPAISRSYSEHKSYGRAGVSVRHDGFKLISRELGWAPGGGRWLDPGEELYDLESDRKELHDIAATNLSRKQQLEALRPGKPAVTAETHTSDASERQLRSLGYVH